MSVNVKAYKKLFLSLLIVVSGIVILFVGIAIYKGITETNVSYEKLESMMLNAAGRYFEQNGLPDIDGETKQVSLPNLVSEGFLKPLSKLTKDTTCNGYVKVNNNGGYNLFIPYLECSEYKTKTLADAIKANLTTAGDGLYEKDGEYIFKGEHVNNYVQFANSLWRIIKIDKNNNVKLIMTQAYKEKVTWDDRYNVTTNSNTGINSYDVSRIKEKLTDIYNTEKMFSENVKKHIVSTDICVGKRSINNFSLDNKDLCDKVLEKQFLSLIDVTEYYNASLDTNCKALSDLSCDNYNYFSSFFTSGWTITGVLENTYEVYKSIAGEPYANKANTTNSIYLVLHVSGNEKFISGSGTETDPFIID